MILVLYFCHCNRQPCSASLSNLRLREILSRVSRRRNKSNLSDGLKFIKLTSQKLKFSGSCGPGMLSRSKCLVRLAVRMVSLACLIYALASSEAPLALSIRSLLSCDPSSRGTSCNHSTSATLYPSWSHDRKIRNRRVPSTYDQSIIFFHWK
uniref:Uncharacterized protein n=1 Tax=Arundo donax TaxID=35708 RepID=A0A0A9HL96_ARUDO